MNKCSGLLLSAVLLTGCFPKRLLPHETFLMFHPGQEKILILSAFPDTNDSTGLYISTLLLHLPEGNGKLAAYVNTFDGQTNRQTTAFYFLEAPRYFDTTDFPVLLTTPAEDSIQSPFSFSLSRSSVAFEAVSPTDHSVLHYDIGFPKQQPFQAQPGTTDLQVNGMQLPAATITQAGNESDQSAVLAIHTVDNGARLFDKSSGHHYYWMDLTIYGRSGYSAFFETDASWNVTVLYSTFPDTLETTIESGILKIRKRDSDESFAISVIAGSRSPLVSKTTFRTMAVNLTQNGQPAGTGIFYQL
jgi:hypothetical protein